MFRNYFKIAWRSLVKHKGHSAINIAGLAIGMTVAMLIGLWIWDELSFNQYDPHYKRVARVMQSQHFNGEIETGAAIPIPLGEELRNNYGSDFKLVALSSWSEDHVLSIGEKHLFPTGPFVEPDGPEVLGLTMVEGDKSALKDPTAIFLSAGLADALFGKVDAMNKVVRMDDTANFIVRGIYKNLPANSNLAQEYTEFMGPWAYYVMSPILCNRKGGPTGVVIAISVM